MPELAELKLTSDYVNKQSKDRIFHGIKKQEYHKGKDIFSDIDFPFVIEAASRGKELMLTISTAPEFATEDNIQVRHLVMTMGMGGNFKWVPTGVTQKHDHLHFISGDGCLAFVDIRRFGKWKWGYWNTERGPDPTLDYSEFVSNIMDNLNHRDFTKPIHEMLMNQKWFNGIGNYLRAEILYRIEGNPFSSSKDYIEKYGTELFTLCRDIPMAVYKLGGGTLKDWKNPFGEISSIGSIMKCYYNPTMNKTKDKNGRTFWYDPKWEKYDKR